MQRAFLGLASVLLLTSLLTGCGGSGGGSSDGRATQDLSPAPDLTAPPDLAPAVSNIKHVVIIVQENHTFDAYFGRYCTAAPGSNPTCTTGPACCEAAPANDPSGASPTVLDDTENGAYDPNHTQACELSEMNGGKMSGYVTGTPCSDPRNFALASTAVQPYYDYAAQYALADRYFQPLAGQSSSNDMYLAVAHYVFTDNDDYPDANGHGCWDMLKTTTLTGTTIGDLLIDAGRSFAFYAAGYDAMKAALLCPSRPADCTFNVPLIQPNTCDYDPSDVPFEYYQQFQDNAQYMKDYNDLATALGAGNLPDVAFVKGMDYTDEHPGYGTTISKGLTLVQNTVSAILASPYADDTLILVTWDEGGGFFDHIAPPADSPADGKPYGTRVPLLALGRFARKNTVSHVVMEHSSLVRFIEFNFLGQTGQLGARDAVVNNIGSLLDPAQTGKLIPAN